MEFTALRIIKFLTLTCKTSCNLSLSHFLTFWSLSTVLVCSIATLAFSFVLSHTTFTLVLEYCHFLSSSVRKFLSLTLILQVSAQILQVREAFLVVKNPIQIPGCQERACTSKEMLSRCDFSKLNWKCGWRVIPLTHPGQRAVWRSLKRWR